MDTTLIPAIRRMALALAFLATAGGLAAQEAGPATADPGQPASQEVIGIESAVLPLETARQPNFFGVPVSMDAHRAGGYVSGGIFAAAATVGLVRYLDLTGANSQGWLKYLHLGLIAGGELAYGFNAITGISLIPRDGKSSRLGELHRTAFFVHAGLLASEMVMGFVTASLIEAGNTAAARDLGLAHAIVGFTVPVVMLSSGVLTNFPGLFGD
jgi:hypothetical protein